MRPLEDTKTRTTSMSRRISVFNTDAVVPGHGNCLGFVHMGCSDMSCCIQTEVLHRRSGGFLRHGPPVLIHFIRFPYISSIFLKRIFHEINHHPFLMFFFGDFPCTKPALVDPP